MLIHKKQTVFKQNVDSRTGQPTDSSFNTRQRVLRTTWYFLGIPVYSTTEILTTTE